MKSTNLKHTLWEVSRKIRKAQVAFVAHAEFVLVLFHAVNVLDSQISFRRQCSKLRRLKPLPV